MKKSDLFTSVTQPYNNWSDTLLMSETTQIQAGMTGNVNFPNPVPSMADYGNAVSDFIDKLGKAGTRDINAIVAKNASRETLIELTISLGNYAAMVSGGVRETLLPTHLPLRKTPQTVLLGKPSNFRCTLGINPGELRLKIDRMDGLVSFNFMYTKYPIVEGAAWETVTSSRSTCLITGLETGSRYAFRVAAIGTNNQIVWGETLQSPIVQ